MERLSGPPEKSHTLVGRKLCLTRGALELTPT